MKQLKIEIDNMKTLAMTLHIDTLLIMTILMTLMTLNTGNITYIDIANN
jgi:hypothetical protein